MMWIDLWMKCGTQLLDKAVGYHFLKGKTTMAGESMGIYREYEYGYFFVSSYFLVTILSKSKKILDHQVLWLFLATWW